ncbi:MAG: hypothetical protein GF308_21555 [Candidatus Heimdallarchaeota archaeon]|nr:hypothetical protein [Candidatus Heimdallarchaeota archaeon]
MTTKKTILIILGLVLGGIIIGGSIGAFFVFRKSDGITMFIAIHCEPGSFPKTTDYPEQYWLDLKEMIINANQSNVKLTLLFNPQWATYILNDSARLQMVRNWEANGHEIGLHHHGAHMNSWNGYTDQAAYQSNPKYIGSIDEMMLLMNQLPLSGEIKTACVGTEEDIDSDFPYSVPYRTYGGSDKMEHLWSSPELTPFNNHDVLSLTHSRFSSESAEINIDHAELKEFIKDKHKNEVIGLVWHVFDYDNHPQEYNELFQYVTEKGILTATVVELMESYF